MTEGDPPEPRVERVERPDGRYVIYFSWPDDDAGETPEAAGGGEDADE